MISGNFRNLFSPYLSLVKKLIVFAFLLVNQSALFAQTDTTHGAWTLQQCIDRAYKENILINQSLLNSNINILTLEQSRANRAPNLNASDAQSFSHGRSVDPFSNQFVNQDITSNNASLSSNVTLYNGLQIGNTIRQNQLNYDAGNLDVEMEKNTIALNVVADYLQILLSYELVDNARKQVEGTTAQVDESKKYVDAGKFPESNLLQVKSQLAADKLAVVNAENQLQMAKVALMQLMELPVTDNFEIVKPEIGDVKQPEIHVTGDVYKTAESFLPEIKSAELKTQSALFGIKIARSQEIPKLTLGGTIRTGYSSASNRYASQTIYNQETIGYLQSNNSEIVLGQIPSTVVSKQNYPFTDQFNDNLNEMISLNLSVPIFNNRLARTAVEKAKVNTEIAKLNEKGTKTQLRKEVEQAVTDEKAAEKQYIASKEAFTSEEMTYQNFEKKFDLGLINSTDLLVEKNNYTKALSNVVTSKYNYLFKIKVVDYYLQKPLTF